MIDSLLIKYIPKKNRTHINSLYREDKRICFVMAWCDGFSRSRVADSISELKDMVETLEADRNADF